MKKDTKKHACIEYKYALCGSVKKRTPGGGKGPYFTVVPYKVTCKTCLKLLELLPEDVELLYPQGVYLRKKR